MDDMALIRKRREKERENRWKMILAYYMMQKIADEQKREEMLQMYALYSTSVTVENLVVRESLLSRLFRKEAGRMSALELLEQMEAGESEDSPFRNLLNKIREKPLSEAESEKAIAEVIEKAPPMIIEEARSEKDRQAAWKEQQEAEKKSRPAGEKPQLPKQDEKALQYEAQLRLKLSFLRKIMPGELFLELCQGLAREGHAVNMNALDIPDAPMRQKVTYASYISRKQALLQMHNGSFANADNIYTSAAYMLAAYEQKDAPQFNTVVADERARELFGSKAFRVYLDSHPGSLVAASQNMFMDITHEGMVKLEQEITERDRKLDIVSRNLRQRASGQTAAYHRMLNRMERFVKSPVEPSEEEKKALISSMGEYVLKDAADEQALKDTLCGLRAVVPEESFGKLLDKVNTARNTTFEAKDFAEPVLREEPEAQREERVLALNGNPDLPV